jgi:hypothetical protein
LHYFCGLSSGEERAILAIVLSGYRLLDTVDFCLNNQQPAFSFDFYFHVSTSFHIHSSFLPSFLYLPHSVSCVHLAQNRRTQWTANVELIIDVGMFDERYQLPAFAIDANAVLSQRLRMSELLLLLLLLLPPPPLHPSIRTAYGPESLPSAIEL